LLLPIDELFFQSPDWFGFETRIRKMVIDIMEPSVKRSIEDREQVIELKKFSEIIKRKVEECEFIIHKAQKRTTH